jgi:hypothetical protein
MHAPREQIWLIQDSQGRIPALVCREKNPENFEVVPFSTLDSSTRSWVRQSKPLTTCEVVGINV